jgi:hypothetical protein
MVSITKINFKEVTKKNWFYFLLFFLILVIYYPLRYSLAIYLSLLTALIVFLYFYTTDFEFLTKQQIIALAFLISFALFLAILFG